MTEAMPLCVLVARALGCTVTLRRLTGAYLCDCEGGAHGGAEDPDYGGAPLLPYAWCGAEWPGTRTPHAPDCPWPALEELARREWAVGQ